MKLLLLIILLLTAAVPAGGQIDAEAPVVFSVPKDETLPVDELTLLLDPLAREDLAQEIDIWRSMLQNKLRTISETQITMKYVNRDIKVVEQIHEGLTSFTVDKKAFEDFRAEALGDTTGSYDDKIRQMEQALLEARIDLTELVKVALGREAKAVEAHNLAAIVSAAIISLRAQAPAEAETYAEFATVGQGLADLRSRVHEAESEVDLDDSDFVATLTMEIAEILRLKQGVAGLLEAYMATLMRDRSELVKRMEVVIKAWQKKGGTPEDIASVRMFIDSVTGFTMAVADQATRMSMVKVWLKSEAGGLKLARDVGRFVLTLLLFGLMASFVGFVTSKSIHRSRNISRLMQDFIIRSVRRVIMLAGVLVGLSLAGVNIAPILGVVGAAGFILAFALQSVLGNFASGIMIMIYKPFDVGDAIDAAGVMGVVKTMNLTSTIINTFDNKLVIIPNTNIWGGVITNITGSKTRRVDLVFRIGYEDDTDEANRIINEVLESEDRILVEPAPTVKIHELGEFTVNFICRPWVKTTDYWDVRWDLIRKIREKLAAAGFAAPIDQSALFNRPPGSKK